MVEGPSPTPSLVEMPPSNRVRFIERSFVLNLSGRRFRRQFVISRHHLYDTEDRFLVDVGGFIVSTKQRHLDLRAREIGAGMPGWGESR